MGVHTIMVIGKPIEKFSLWGINDMTAKISNSSKGNEGVLIVGYFGGFTR
jgi:hypothetical protein